MSTRIEYQIYGVKTVGGSELNIVLGDASNPNSEALVTQAFMDDLYALFDSTGDFTDLVVNKITYGVDVDNVTPI